MRHAERLIMAAMVSMAAGARAGEGGHQKLQAVPFTDVRIEDSFWAPRIETNRTKSLPHNIKWCEQTGRISNFAKAAGQMPGKFEGIYFNDSDVYKVLEGASYSLASHPDKDLEQKVDEIIAKIAAAQQKDGYLNTYYTLAEPGKRWTNFPAMHELYCSGHLFEAAVAHYRATGKRTLLDVACKLADHIDSVIGPDRIHAVPGHEEIELALVKLYRVTNEQRYLKLAQFFLDERGNPRGGRRSYGEYCQDHKPVREQSEICGHAVRAMYLFSGVADIAAITGDKGLIGAMDRIWQDVALRKMYITGGIGPSAHNEGFTVAYDLANDTAYAETCASIGMALWNHRLNLLHADARYADVFERVLYNGLLSGVSLDGESFFYVNPLASRGRHHRQSWFDCACCPSNMVRFLPSLGGYVYAYSDDAVYVNLYIAGSGKVPIKGTTVKITQATRYPWEGAVELSVDPAAVAAFGVCLRVPGWCEGARLKVNGKPLEKIEIDSGYARIQREWKAGDTIQLELPMEIVRVEANPRVKADVGRVALQRGPIVYCLEGVDNNGRVRHLALPREAKLSAEHRGDLLGGVTVIQGTAIAVSAAGWEDVLYRKQPQPEGAEFVAVPYYAWDNRKPGEMVVWLPETPAFAEALPAPTIAHTSKASASHVNPRDGLPALSDQDEPANSNDLNVRRFTWWDHKGTTEWVQYDFKEPQKVLAVEVYWFDDARTNGGCRVPKAWKLLWKDGEAWKPVAAASEYGTKADQYNRVTFEPVTASGLRIEVELQKDLSGGMLEWRVMK